MLTKEQIERKITEEENYEDFLIGRLIDKLEDLRDTAQPMFYDKAVGYCEVFLKNYMDTAKSLEDLQIMLEEA